MMKRFLSWLALVACFFVVCLVEVLDLNLLSRIGKLYERLPSLFKNIMILISGAFLLSLALVPIWYGLPRSIAASEAIYPSKKGNRYLVLGSLIIVSSIAEIISRSIVYGVIIGIYGFALIVYGRGINKKP